MPEIPNVIDLTEAVARAKANAARRRVGAPSGRPMPSSAGGPPMPPPPGSSPDLSRIGQVKDKVGELAGSLIDTIPGFDRNVFGASLHDWWRDFRKESLNLHGLGRLGKEMVFSGAPANAAKLITKAALVSLTGPQHAAEVSIVVSAMFGAGLAVRNDGQKQFRSNLYDISLKDRLNVLSGYTNLTPAEDEELKRLKSTITTEPTYNDKVRREHIQKEFAKFNKRKEKRQGESAADYKARQAQLKKEEEFAKKHFNHRRLAMAGLRGAMYGAIGLEVAAGVKDFIGSIHPGIGMPNLNGLGSLIHDSSSNVESAAYGGLHGFPDVQSKLDSLGNIISEHNPLAASPGHPGGVTPVPTETPLPSPTDSATAVAGHSIVPSPTETPVATPTHEVVAGHSGGPPPTETSTALPSATETSTTVPTASASSINPNPSPDRNPLSGIGDAINKDSNDLINGAGAGFSEFGGAVNDRSNQIISGAATGFSEFGSKIPHPTPLPWDAPGGPEFPDLLNGAGAGFSEFGGAVNDRSNQIISGGATGFSEFGGKVHDVLSGHSSPAAPQRVLPGVTSTPQASVPAPGATFHPPIASPEGPTGFENPDRVAHTALPLSSDNPEATLGLHDGPVGYEEAASHPVTIPDVLTQPVHIAEGQTFDEQFQQHLQSIHHGSHGWINENGVTQTDVESDFVRQAAHTQGIDLNVISANSDIIPSHVITPAQSAVFEHITETASAQDYFNLQGSVHEVLNNPGVDPSHFVSGDTTLPNLTGPLDIDQLFKHVQEVFGDHITVDATTPSIWDASKQYLSHALGHAPNNEEILRLTKGIMSAYNLDEAAAEKIPVGTVFNFDKLPIREAFASLIKK